MTTFMFSHFGFEIWWIWKITFFLRFELTLYKQWWQIPRINHPHCNICSQKWQQSGFSYYRPPTKLPEGNAFRCVCLSVSMSTRGLMWALPMIHWTSQPAPPPVWWPQVPVTLLVTFGGQDCSNLRISHGADFSGFFSKYSGRVDSMHPTGMLFVLVLKLGELV